MGKPRTPTAILELKGSFKKDPQRRRAPEPKSKGPLGDPPGRLPEEVLPFWYEIVSFAAKEVLKISDRWTVERISRLMWKASQPDPSVDKYLELLKAGFEVADIRAIMMRAKFTSSDEANLRGYLSSLGFDPAARSKLSVSQAKPKNAFAELAEEAKSFTQRPN